jgi:hypothetical protein
MTEIKILKIRRNEMTDIAIALLEENKRLQERIDELHIDLTKALARPNMAALYAKKALVMSKINRVKETGKHQQGWKYATSEDIKDEVRQAMAEAGLSLSFELVSYDIERTDKRITITGVMAYTLECGETGASETKMFSAEAIDYGKAMAPSAEKTFYKLYTTSEKYFLKTTFLVASGDELDSDSDAPPSSKKQSVGKKSPEIAKGPLPWRPTKGEFFAKATKEFPSLSLEDISDELKEAGFLEYNVDKAVEMMTALRERIKTEKSK